MELFIKARLLLACLTARYSSMFDDIYWMFLNKLYFGSLGSIEDRIQLLDEQEQKELAGIFQEKIK
jgi:hypothetical protein